MWKRLLVSAFKFLLKSGAIEAAAEAAIKAKTQPKPAEPEKDAQ
jgi:hypothetical protein